MALPHGQWKQVTITNAEGALGLQDGDKLTIAMDGGDLKVKLDRGGNISVWGEGCVSTTQLIVVRGKHKSSGRFFEMTCVSGSGGKWTQVGVLTTHTVMGLQPGKPGGPIGGNGTWTAEEGP